MPPPETPMPEDKRARLRQATLGTQFNQKTVLVEANGEQLEVRKLTIAQTKYIQRTAVKRDGSPDEIRMGLLTLIYSVYVPGTNERVYDEKDEQELGGKSVDDWMERLFDAVAAVNKKDAPPEPGEEPPVLKNSDRTSAASSST